MTDLLDAYQRHREQGQNHNGALNALARRFDMDKATVSRIIERAERAEAADRHRGRVRNRHVQPHSPEQSPAKKTPDTPGGYREKSSRHARHPALADFPPRSRKAAR